MDKKNLTTEETFALAIQNHKKNNLQVAENLYTEILKTNPNHVDAHNNLGIIFLLNFNKELMIKLNQENVISNTQN